MGIDFKKRIIGYNPKQVKSSLKKEQDNYNKLIKEYELQLQHLKKEKNRLKRQIDEQETNTADNENLDVRLKDLLYNAHIDSCKRIVEMNRTFDRMIEYKLRILNKQADKNKKIKASINDLLSHVEAILEK
jgi:hypothetical protein